MANYYRTFVPDFASTLHLLRVLLEKDRKFEWTDDVDDVFLAVKRALCESVFLVHFGSSLTGWCWIQSASRSLTRVEQKYSQIDGEELGIIFGVKRFYPFRFGRKFTLVIYINP